MRPNIILITTDQHRYDTLGCNGSRVVRTPALDRLAEDGARFENAFINNPVCIPSRACIQTGRYTHQHGVRYMESVIDRTPGLPPWEETFMQRLQAAGYDTGAVGKIHMLPPKGFNHTRLTNGKGHRWTVPYGSPLGPSQLGEAYARWLDAQSPGAYERLYEQRRQPEYEKYKGAIINVLPKEQYIDWWITDNAIEFASRERDQPFFLWFGLCNPHGPFDPPADYAHLYPEDELELSERYLNRPNQDDGLSEAVVRRVTSYYYALCTFIDDMVERLVTTLKQNNLYDDTLILFTADHGEMLGDFGRFGKGNFDDAVIRTPMIVKPPRGGAAGKTISGLVELIDVAPTVLDYASLPVAETIEGRSMRPLIEGDAPGKDVVLCEYTSNDQARHGKCIRDDRYKYAYWGPEARAELYDMQEDPGEWHNLAEEPGYQDLRIRMHERLLERLMLTERPIHWV